MSYNFNKMYRDNDNWHIFPNASLKVIELSGCEKSTRGICLDKSFEECLSICKEDDVLLGYYIETKDKNICVPLRKYTNEVINPFHRIIDKDSYKDLQRLNSYVFVNKKLEFPPNDTSNIFYTDKFTLSVNNLNITYNEDGTVTEKIVLTDENPIILQFLPKEIYRSGLEKYDNVRAGDEVIVNIPDTSYLLHANKDILQWLLRATTANGPNNIFKVYAKDKNIGDSLNFKDTLYFTHNEQNIYLDPVSNNLSINTGTNKTLSYFLIKPKVIVYYCKDNKCLSTTLDKCNIKDNIAFYEDKQVRRSDTCWNQCNHKDLTKNKGLFFLILLLAFLLVLIIFFIRKRFIS